MLFSLLDVPAHSSTSPPSCATQASPASRWAVRAACVCWRQFPRVGLVSTLPLPSPADDHVLLRSLGQCTRIQGDDAPRESVRQICGGLSCGDGPVLLSVRPCTHPDLITDLTATHSTLPEWRGSAQRRQQGGGDATVKSQRARRAAVLRGQGLPPSPPAPPCLLAHSSPQIAAEQQQPAAARPPPAAWRADSSSSPSVRLSIAARSRHSRQSASEPSGEAWLSARRRPSRALSLLCLLGAPGRTRSPHGARTSRASRAGARPHSPAAAQPPPTRRSRRCSLPPQQLTTRISHGAARLHRGGAAGHLRVGGQRAAQPAQAQHRARLCRRRWVDSVGRGPGSRLACSIAGLPACSC